MWPFKPKTYELQLEFLSNTPERLQQVERARAMLALELQSGRVSKCEAGASAINLLIVSTSPKHCLGEALVYLEEILLLPDMAKIRNIETEKWGQIWTLEAGKKKVAALDSQRTFEVRLEFTGNTPERLRQVESARDALSKNKGGKIGRCESKDNTIHLFLTTKSAKLWFIETMGLLHHLSLLPDFVMFRNIKREKWLLLWSREAARKKSLI